MNEDLINEPYHYASYAIQVWDAIAAWKLNYFRGCIVKYVVRAGRKNAATELEDLQKAQAYLAREIERVMLEMTPVADIEPVPAWVSHDPDHEDDDKPSGVLK